MSTQVDIQQLVPDLYRVRIPTTKAHLLNSYLWLGSDGVTVVDTGWPGSAPILGRALEQLGRGTDDVERVVLSHFTTITSGQPRRSRHGRRLPSWLGVRMLRSSVACNRAPGRRSAKPNSSESPHARHNRTPTTMPGRPRS